MDYREDQGGGGRLIKRNTEIHPHIHKVYCFPFESMMLALNRQHIDYFSLDVEGLELDVLKTIPFDKLDISILTVEYLHVKGSEAALERFMVTKGFKTHSKIRVTKAILGLYAYDLVFVKISKY